MQFQKKVCDNGKDIYNIVEFDSFNEAWEYMNDLFKKEMYVRFEEMKFDNGKRSLSLKDAGNKIMIQLKTLNHGTHY